MILIDIKRYFKLGISLFVLFILFNHFSIVYAQTPPSISQVTDNRTDYTNSQIPKYEKFEITFQVSTSAVNYQLPLLSPTTASPELANFSDLGVSVDAVFTDPNNNTFNQPAFYYEDFQVETRNNKDWFYPNGNFSWKVRFSPNTPGTWQYYLKVQDKDGSFQTQPQSFTVINSNNKGFLKVSPTDPRYFEYDDGTTFTGLGYNKSVRSLNNDNLLQELNQNHVQLIRGWLSALGIFGSQWETWELMPGVYDDNLPRVGILPYQYPNASTEFMWYLSQTSSWYSSCMILGHTQPQFAIKPNTSYLVKAVFKGEGITGPRNAGYPDYGFVIKTGGWINNCQDSNTGVIVTSRGQDTADFQEVKGVWNSGSNNFLPFFYMSLENALAGKVYVKSFEITEMTGGTVDQPILTGPNIVDKPSAQQQLYMAQGASFAFDKILEKLENNDIYLKAVILEKEEYLFKKMDASAAPLFIDDIANFYGSGRNLYGPRWLQQAWWRYLQARWGYSQNIHSWELLNEGDPYNRNHYALTDELGKYMHCTAFGVNVGTGNANKCNFDHPNDHLVTTSFWEHFPTLPFWGNANYPNVDYADIHQYVFRDKNIDLRVDNPNGGDKTLVSTTADHYDAAASTYNLSTKIGAKEPFGVNKPVVRGEVGFTNTGSGPSVVELRSDTTGTWLHNFVWGQINSGGLYESYWYVSGPDGHIANTTYATDHRSIYNTYYNFIKDIPLSNGHYEDIAATIGNSNLRVWGQKDVTNGNAHVWIQNKNHTWGNIFNNVAVAPETGDATVCGFDSFANQNLTLEIWDTYAGTKQTSTAAVQNDGCFTLSITNLSTDMAFKIINPTPPNVTPTPGQTKPGDVNGDNYVNISDLGILLSNFGTSSSVGDVNGDGRVNISDLGILLSNFGT